MSFIWSVINRIVIMEKTLCESKEKQFSTIERITETILSAISVMSKEIGRGFACFVFCFQILLAYFMSFVVYQGSMMILSKRFGLIFMLIVLALMVFVMIKYSGRKKSCKSCKERCHGNVCCPKL